MNFSFCSRLLESVIFNLHCPSTIMHGVALIRSLPHLDLINTKCDGIPPRPRAAGEGEQSAVLKQNQIVEIWEVLPGQHLACMGPTTLCNSI